VRELAEFCHRSGDIDYRFTPSPSAAEGIAGHQRVQRSRGEDYIPEHPMEARIQCGELSLRVAGRADGYQATPPLLEEIKTCRVEREMIPPAVEAMHWSQLMLYGGLLCHNQDVDSVMLVLTYFHVESGIEWQRREPVGRLPLLEFLQETVASMHKWLLLQRDWQQRRNASLSALDWPFSSFRDSQRSMAETVYKCIATSGSALLEAPTGTGKTAAALFPALKAMGAGKHERIVFATSRTVGRRAAEQGLRQMEQAGAVLRRLSLSAKESICFSPGKACQGDDCAYAAGYYDRLPQALYAAMEQPDLDRPAVEALAREHMVCPYQLAMDLLPWVDVCIGDVHYVYSLQPAVAARYQAGALRWSLLLDEAHNLPDRARNMFSATLAKVALMQARREASGSIRTALNNLNRVLLALDKLPWQEETFDSRETVPLDLPPALSRVVSSVSEALGEDASRLQASPALLQFFFDCLQFQRVLEQWGDDYRFERQRDGSKQGLSLCLRCLDPARLLRQRHAMPGSIAAFSATASPASWMLSELGMERAVYQSLPSPFRPSQLKVTLCTALDTRYRAREKTLHAVAARIADWLADNPGNCLVYFSAYSYMEAVLSAAQPMIHGRDLRVQQRQWDEAARQALLDDLSRQRDIAAFCILGGVFGEGVDLPGEALSSVVIVGAGLPRFNREREVLRHYFQSRHGHGFEFAYMYPGLQKVAQALGRVVRSEQDSGSALLIDSRFADPSYRALLPPWWSYEPA